MLELVHNYVLVGLPLAVGTEAVALDLQGLSRLVKGLLKASANAHNLANRLHLQSESAVCALKLVKVPSRNFHNDVVQGRLKIGRCGLGDLVVQLVERVPNSELGRDLGNGIPGSLGGQGRGSRNPWIDFDGYDVFALVWTNRKLHVATAGEVANGPHHLDGHVAHALVGTV